MFVKSDFMQNYDIKKYVFHQPFQIKMSWLMVDEKKMKKI